MSQLNREPFSAGIENGDGWKSIRVQNVSNDLYSRRIEFNKPEYKEINILFLYREENKARAWWTEFELMFLLDKLLMVLLSGNSN